MMARDVTNPWSTNDKAEVLRTLQGSVFFEKTVIASSASGTHAKLAVPKWFVQRHGDKFRKSVILRTVMSTKAWPVTTSVCVRSSTCSQVQFVGGWKDFAAFNGLLENDLLIFSLTAMSEFEVYVFRSTGSTTGFTSLKVQRKQTYDSKILQKKAAKQSYACSDGKLAADGSIEGTVQKSSPLRIAKNTIVAGERAARDSKSVGSSFRGHHDSKKGQELPALNYDELLTSEPGAIGGRKNPGSEHRGQTRSDILRKLQGSVYFEKRVTVSSASGYLGNDTKLALPISFVQKHGHLFQKPVILQTELSTKPWPVTIRTSINSPTCKQMKLAGGWKAFATFHGLMVGDSLIFSLTAVSEFEVHIFSSTGNPKKLLSQPAPTKWWNDFGLPRKKAKYECKNEQLSAEEGVEGLGNSSKRNDIKSKNVINSSSKGRQYYDSEKGQEHALDNNEPSVPGASDRRKNPGNEYRGRTLQKSARNFVLPGFFKKVRVCDTVMQGEKGGIPAYMEIPSDFCRTHGSRLHSPVKLQGICEDSQVRTVACHVRVRHGDHTRIFLRGGWAKFANENDLVAGQELLFTLTADSYFVVREVMPPSYMAQERVSI